METLKINIFDYADHIAYLSEYQQNRVKEDKSFSKSGICKKLGLPNTRSYFNEILEGARALTPPMIRRFVEVFEMDDEEAQYFKILVEFNTSDRENERQYLFEQLIALNRTPRKFMDPKVFEFYKEWYHSSIRAMLDVYDIKTNIKDLAHKLVPAVSLKKVKESFKLLSKLGLIKKNEFGYWKPTDKVISLENNLLKKLLEQYQLKCIELGKKAVISKNNKYRNLSTMTLSFSTEGLKLIEKRFQKFKSEVRSITHKDTNVAEHVYQMNIQFFPQNR